MSETHEHEHVTFLGFLISLAHTAAVHLGDVTDPARANGRRSTCRRRSR
jgi:hypothetical protein